MDSCHGAGRGGVLDLCVGVKKPPTPVGAEVSGKMA